MSIVETFSSDLIVLKNRLKSVDKTKEGDKLNINLNDIDLLISVSKFNSNELEQKIMSSRLSLENNKFNFLVKRIFVNLDVCFEFWNAHQHKLRTFDTEELMNNSLRPFQLRSDTHYKDLLVISKKKDEIVYKLNKFSINHGEDHFVIQNYRAQEKAIEKEYRTAKEEYRISFSQLENKRREISKFYKFCFESAFSELNELREIFVQHFDHSKDSIVENGIIGMDICGIFHRITKDMFEEQLDELVIYSVLNLKKPLVQPSDIIHGCTEKLLFTIQCVSKKIPKHDNQRNQWEEHVLGFFGQDKDSTYKKKRKILAEENKDFRNQVENVFDIVSRNMMPFDL